jgi:hypothetical protein
MNQLIEKEFINQIIFSEISSNQDLNRHLQRVNQLKQTGMIEEGIETKILIPRKLISISNLELQLKLNPFHESNEIYKEQKAIYKSIARKLRKTQLKQHRHCIRDLTLKGSFSDICHHAHAYVCWRKFIEGANGYHNVHNGQTRKDIYYTTPRAHYSQLFNEDLRKFESECEKAFNIINEEKGASNLDFQRLSTSIRNWLYVS